MSALATREHVEVACYFLVVVSTAKELAMRRLLPVAVAATLIAVSVASCGKQPFAPSLSAQHGVTRLNKPTIMIYPDGEGQSETGMSSPYVNVPDPSTTVQVVDLGGQTYLRREFIIYEAPFVIANRGLSVMGLEAMESINTVADTTTLWALADSVVTIFEPIDLGGDSPEAVAYGAAQTPPPQEPPRPQIPPVVTTPPPDSPPRIAKVSWGQVKARYR